MVHHVATWSEFQKFLEDTKAAGKLLVVDFTATWCGPCQRIAPAFERLAGEHNAKAVFVKVDVDANEETAGKCGISSMPTFQFYKGGSKVKEFSGASEANLAATITDLLK